MMKQDFSHPNAQPFRLGAGEDACMLIHGFTGSPAHMRPLGESLAARGFLVEGILLPGHGSDIKQMERSRWRDWLDCAKEAAVRLGKGHRRVFAAGLSMGGVLSLLLAQQGLVHGVASLAAPIRTYQQRSAFFAPAVWPLLRFNPHKKQLLTEGFFDEYDYGYDSVPVRRVGDLNRLMRMARRGLARVECPLLVVQSRADETVRPVSADIIYAGASSARKEIMMLSESPHVLTLGPEREQVFNRVGLFFRSIRP